MPSSVSGAAAPGTISHVGDRSPRTAPLHVPGVREAFGVMTMTAACEIQVSASRASNTQALDRVVQGSSIRYVALAGQGTGDGKKASSCDKSHHSGPQTAYLYGVRAAPSARPGPAKRAEGESWRASFTAQGQGMHSGLLSHPHLGSMPDASAALNLRQSSAAAERDLKDSSVMAWSFPPAKPSRHSSPRLHLASGPRAPPKTSSSASTGATLPSCVSSLGRLILATPPSTATAFRFGQGSSLLASRCSSASRHRP